MKDTIKKYLEKKSIFKTKTFDCSEIAVCIPIYNEYPNFMSVLKTLAISCAVANQQVQVVCCVNNKKNCNNEILENNFKMIYELSIETPKVACNDVFKKEMGIKGREYIKENFSRNIVIDEYLKKINELV